MLPWGYSARDEARLGRGSEACSIFKSPVAAGVGSACLVVVVADAGGDDGVSL